MQISTTTCTAAGSGTVCITEVDASSSALYADGFSYGEIINSVLLLFIAVVAVYGFLWFSTKGFKIRQ